MLKRCLKVCGAFIVKQLATSASQKAAQMQIRTRTAAFPIPLKLIAPRQTEMPAQSDLFHNQLLEAGEQRYKVLRRVKIRE